MSLHRQYARLRGSNQARRCGRTEQPDVGHGHGPPAFGTRRGRETVTGKVRGTGVDRDTSRDH